MSWQRDGLFGPVQVLDTREATVVADGFQREYAQSGNPATMNRHADLSVLGALCDDARLWEPAHRLLGGQLLLWRTNIFLGCPRLPWHEDRHTMLFENGAFSLSILLAIKASCRDNCIVVVPGSHALSPIEKGAAYGIVPDHQASGNVRYKGRVADRHYVSVVLNAGEMVLLHPGLLHASSAHVAGTSQVAPDRMHLTMRVVTTRESVTAAAFPGEASDPERILRVRNRSVP